MKHCFFILLVFALLISGCSKNNHTTVSPNKLTAPSPKQEFPTESVSNVLPNQNSPQTQDKIQPTLSVSSYMKNIVTAITSNSIEPLSFDDNYYYVLGENNWFDTSANIIILNNQKEIVKTFKQAIVDIGTIGKIDKNIPFIVGLSDFSKIVTYNDYIKSKNIDDYGLINFNFGLYLPGKDTYLIEPIYHSLIQYDDNILGGYSKDELVFFDMNGNILFGPISSKDVTVTFTSNTIWLISKTKPTYVYDKQFNLLKELDSSNIDFYSYGDDFIYCRNSNIAGLLNEQIYDSYGTLILSKEILLEQSDIPTDILTSDTVINSVYRDSGIALFQVYIGSYTYLIDDNYHVIDSINTIETPGYNFLTKNNHYTKYNYNNRNEVILRKNDGTIVFDENGQSFNEALSSTIVSGINNNVLTIYNSETKESYSHLLNPTNYISPSLTSLTPDLFYIVNTIEPYYFSLYHRDKLILESRDYQYSYITLDDNYFAFREISDSYDYTSIYTIIDNWGNVKYTSPYKETLITGDKNYLLVQRGNYIGLTDYNGDFVYKLIIPSTTTD